MKKLLKDISEHDLHMTSMYIKIQLEESHIFIVGTEILSYIETMQLFETSLGLWLASP